MERAVIQAGDSGDGGLATNAGISGILTMWRWTVPAIYL